MPKFVGGEANQIRMGMERLLKEKKREQQESDTGADQQEQVSGDVRGEDGSEDRELAAALSRKASLAIQQGNVRMDAVLKYRTLMDGYILRRTHLSTDFSGRPLLNLPARITIVIELEPSRSELMAQHKAMGDSAKQ